MKKFLLLPMNMFSKLAEKATYKPAKLIIKTIGFLTSGLVYLVIVAQVITITTVLLIPSDASNQTDVFLLALTLLVVPIYYLLPLGLAFIISRINKNTMSFGKYKVILSSVGVFLIIGWQTRPAFLFGVKVSLAEYIDGVRAGNISSGSHLADLNGHLLIFALIGGALGAAAWSFIKRSRPSTVLVTEVHGTRNNKATPDDRETRTRLEAEARAKTAMEQQPETEDEMRERIRREMEAAPTSST